MEHLFAMVPSWIWHIVAFCFGYGICRLMNLDNIEEGQRVRKAEEDRLLKFIADTKAEHAKWSVEHDPQEVGK